MKKLKYLAFLMIVSVIGLTSCNGDDDKPKEPNIALNAGNGYTVNGAEIMLGETAKFGVIATPNDNSKEKLVNFKLEMIHNNLPTTLLDSTFKEKNFNLDILTAPFEEAGDYNFNFTIKDKAGKEASVSAMIKVVSGTVGLTEAAPFEWKRVAGAAGTGLEMFGLKWTSNAKVVHAQIKKDGASKFVKLNSSACTSITNEAELVAAVEAAADMEVYAGVSAEANSDYNDVLATVYNGKYYLIHVKNGKIETGSAGTTITIKGLYKTVVE